MNLSPKLIDAIRDYSLLLEKGYPDKRTLTLIADRYGLDRHQRGVLFRGVFRKENAGERIRKIKTRLDRNFNGLYVDLLNQLYTVISYLRGEMVFISMDGVLRDAAEKHGKPVPVTYLSQSIQLIMKYLEGYPEVSIQFFLDEKPDFHQAVKLRMEAHSDAGKMDGLLMVSDDVDRILSEKEDGLLVTSDSTIIDRTKRGVFDLARAVIELNFKAKIPDLRSILP